MCWVWCWNTVWEKEIVSYIWPIPFCCSSCSEAIPEAANTITHKHTLTWVLRYTLTDWPLLGESASQCCRASPPPQRAEGRAKETGWERERGAWEYRTTVQSILNNAASMQQELCFPSASLPLESSLPSYMSLLCLSRSTRCFARCFLSHLSPFFLLFAISSAQNQLKRPWGQWEHIGAAQRLHRLQMKVKTLSSFFQVPGVIQWEVQESWLWF